MAILTDFTVLMAVAIYCCTAIAVMLAVGTVFELLKLSHICITSTVLVNLLNSDV